MSRLPRALDHAGAIAAALGGGPALICLDYDGTLTPIVERPELAELAGSTREVLRRLARRFPLAVVSGRDLRDVRRRVGLDGVYYAGSHGFEIDGPGEVAHVHPAGRAALPALDGAERRLRRELGPIDGAQVERKRFSVAVHTRRVDRAAVSTVERVVDAVLADRPELIAGRGKEVLELRPAAPWDKGRAVRWLMEALGRPGRPLARALYVGDDTTDEDAFRALAGDGIGVLVGEDRPTAADYIVADPDDAVRLLDLLAGGGAGGDGPGQ